MRPGPAVVSVLADIFQRHAYPIASHAERFDNVRQQAHSSHARRTVTQTDDSGNPEGSERVRITVLLEGGHRETVTVSVQDPQLEALMRQLGAPDAGLRLLQLPVREGQAMLAVRSDRIVGVLSEPPMQMDFSDEPVAAPVVEVSKVFVKDGFLPPEQLERVHAYA